MLLYRILTAAVLAPLVIGGVIYMEPRQFSLLWALVLLVGAWEWSDLISVQNPLCRGFFVAGLALAIWLGRDWAFIAVPLHPVILVTTLLAVGWWLLISVAMRLHPGLLLQLQLPLPLKILLGWFILYTAWLLLARLMAHFGNHALLFLLLLIWVADSAAYFSGRRWGRVKLAPFLSPGKTREGMDGALAGGMLLAGLTAWYVGMAFYLVPYFLLLAALTVIVSINGDLFESLAKRIRGVKDSGHILPGHGGILDRIDSLLAAIPVFYAGLMMKEIVL